MSDFIRIAALSELPNPGEAREYVCGSRTLCVANINGAYFAIDNVCPHRGGPLGQGIVEGPNVVCPWHGWEFEAATGRSPMGSDISVPTYELKIDGNEVFARPR